MSLWVDGDVNTRTRKVRRSCSLPPLLSVSASPIKVIYHHHWDSAAHGLPHWSIRVDLARKTEVTSGICNRGNLVEGTGYHCNWDWHQQEATTKTGGTKRASCAPEERVGRPFILALFPSPHSNSSALQFPFGWIHLTKESKRATCRVSLLRYRVEQDKKEWRPKIQQTSYAPQLLSQKCWSASLRYRLMWETSWEDLRAIIHLTGERVRERLTCSQPHLYPLTPHLYQPVVVLHVPEEELFSRTWNQSSSQLESRGKEGENHSFLPFLLIPPHSSSFFLSLSPSTLCCPHFLYLHHHSSVSNSVFISFLCLATSPQFFISISFLLKNCMSWQAAW